MADQREKSSDSVPMLMQCCYQLILWIMYLCMTPYMRYDHDT